MVNIRGERPPEANVVGTSSWESSSEAEEKRSWGRVGRARDGVGALVACLKGDRKQTTWCT